MLEYIVCGCSPFHDDEERHFEGGQMIPLGKGPSLVLPRAADIVVRAVVAQPGGCEPLEAPRMKIDFASSRYSLWLPCTPLQLLS